MEQEPIVLSEIFWGNILRRLIKQHKFRHDNQEPSKIQVVMIEEIGGIEVEFIAQVREVSTFEEVPLYCIVCGGTGSEDNSMMVVSRPDNDEAPVHFLCQGELEGLDDSNRPLGTGGHSEPDLPSSANSLGES